MLSLLYTTIQASSDCPNLIQLAFGLGMHIKQSTIWNALLFDCCSAGGVTCATQRVTQISWINLGLNGTINETAIPNGLTHLYLDENKLTGTIPSYFPAGLITLWLDGNKLYGNLPSFPSTLQYIDLGYPGFPGNRFSGTLRLNRPIRLYINDNWITDVVIQDSSQINPSWCDLSNNPLLGNPSIVGLTTCIKNGIYSASLLPNTKSSVVTFSTLHRLTTTKVEKSSSKNAAETTGTAIKFDSHLSIPKTTSTLVTLLTGSTLIAKKLMSPWLLSNTRTSETILTSIGNISGIKSISASKAIILKSGDERTANGFQLIFVPIVYTWRLLDLIKIVLRLVGQVIVISLVIYKTPWKREFKNKKQKRKKGVVSGSLLLTALH